MEPEVEPAVQSDQVNTVPHQDLSQDVDVVELVEEYALFAMLVLAVLFFLYRKTRQGVESAIFAKRARDAEESMRRTRELQQARYELDTAERRETLAKIEEDRRKQKLEEMEAASQGRSAKKPETKKPKDMRDYWDNKSSFNPGGGSVQRFKPTTKRRGG
eukprot:CAMPEP_0181330318 /NCGR_PEP_ID=MMETSP1101-20121128/23831_1 /TAXON_ID=46948 /ORGANISM="Rhodomonas abbreviata, Strain Caron Lab Isolate" /LENGTH=159 /DNA_ID=CAMNT_0023439557 /DNA_START=39 /DNA_END=518 /DNA_ORIENTATION=+